MELSFGAARLLAAGLPLAFLSFGALAQGASSLISVGDHRLEVIAKGDGNPAVVFESGFTGGMALWRTVQDRIAERTRTIAYERAGLGRSENGPVPRTAKQIAIELHELLERERVSGPIVLVGHSAGGMYARVFAHEYPKQIAALVLVDPATEGYYERLRNETPDEWKNAPMRMQVGPRQQWAALPVAMKRSGLGVAVAVGPGVDFHRENAAWKLASPVRPGHGGMAARARGSRVAYSRRRAGHDRRGKSPDLAERTVTRRKDIDAGRSRPDQALMAPSWRRRQVESATRSGHQRLL